MMQGHDVEFCFINFSLKEDFIFLSFKFDVFEIIMLKWKNAPRICHILEKMFVVFQYLVIT
jgi:hypothetical protein